jgi:phage regulator Rha-like protein
MTKTKSKQLIIIPDERIINKIYLIRGKKVMFDRDLAELYGVDTRTLNQAVRRNTKRFPEDFMFQLSDGEFLNWVSQIVIPNNKKMGLRIKPLVFTEQGVAMLSAVLKSKRAIEVSIQIVRTFVKLREILLTHKELRDKIEAMERKFQKHDDNFKIVFKAISRLMKDDALPAGRIGFGEK